MNQKRRIATAPRFLPTLLVALATGSYAASPEPAVRITGRLFIPDRSVNDLVLSVEVEDACLYAEVTENGWFTILLPKGALANLAFMKPGHLTKEVVIDTKSAFSGDRSVKRDRELEFDVVMVPEAKHPGQSYIGPVGSVGYANGSGLVRVRHDRRLSASKSR